MEYHDLKELELRYQRRILSYHEPRYFAAEDRAFYVNFYRGKMKGFSTQLAGCTYKRAIIACFTEGLLAQKDLTEVLKEIERIRADLKQKNWAVHEYGGALIEPFPISDLVEEEGAHPAIHFWVLCKAVDFFWKISEQLLTAQKHGVPGLKEEHAIWGRAKEGFVKMLKEAPAPVIAFKLEGKGASMRIKKLYAELLQERFIDSKTTPEQFASVFNGIPVEQPVIWRKQQTQLIYLLGAMVNYKLLTAPQGIAYGSWLYPRIIAGFLNKHEEPFIAKKLTQTLHDIERKERQPAHRDFLESLAMRIAAMDWKDALGVTED